MRNYWSLEEIISEEERIPTKTRLDVKHGIYLMESSGTMGGHNSSSSSSSGSENATVLPSKAAVKLPLWLAVHLKQRLRGKNPFAFEKPTMFCDTLLYSLACDAEVVDLRKHSAFYFEVGMRVASLLSRESDDMIKLQKYLKNAASARWTAMLTHLGKGGTNACANPLFQKRLTYTEECIFHAVRDVERECERRVFKVDRSEPAAKRCRVDD